MRMHTVFAVQQDALYDILTKCQNEPKWQIIYLLTYI